MPEKCCTVCLAAVVREGCGRAGCCPWSESALPVCIRAKNGHIGRQSIKGMRLPGGVIGVREWNFPFNSEKKPNYLRVHIIWAVPPKALALISTTFFSYTFLFLTLLHLILAYSPFFFCFKVFSQTILSAIHRTHSLTFFKPILKSQCISQLLPSTHFRSLEQPQFIINHDCVDCLV